MPNAVSDVMSDVMPDAVSDVMSDVMPDAVSDFMPDVVPDVVSDVMPDVMSDVVSDVMPDVMSDVVSDIALQNRPAIHTVSSGWNSSQIPVASNQQIAIVIPCHSRAGGRKAVTPFANLQSSILNLPFFPPPTCLQTSLPAFP
jgi:hypothetical protein